MNNEKVRENRLRRQLDRMGYRLTKSRRRDEMAVDYGGYMIMDKWRNSVVQGCHPYAYSLSVDDVKEFIRMEKGPNRPKRTGR